MAVGLPRPIRPYIYHVECTSQMFMFMQFRLLQYYSSLNQYMRVCKLAPKTLTPSPKIFLDLP